MNRCVQLQPLSKRLKLIDEQPRDSERPAKRVDIHVRRRWNKKYFIIDGKMKRANFSETKHLSSWSSHINKQCSECAFVHINISLAISLFSHFSLRRFAPLFSSSLRENWELFGALSGLRKGMKFSIWPLFHCFVINSVWRAQILCCRRWWALSRFRKQRKPRILTATADNVSRRYNVLQLLLNISNCVPKSENGYTERHCVVIKEREGGRSCVNSITIHRWWVKISALMKIPTRNE